MQFGHGTGDFWHDQPEAVGQSVKTRLLLFSGEWFLNTRAGTPWGGFPLNDLVVKQGRILGVHTQLSRDAAIRDRILTTRGVTGITNYYSVVDPNTRTFSVGATVDTIYGRQFTVTLATPTSGQPVVHVALKPMAVFTRSIPRPPILARLPAR
jgi:hypothetical protein